MIFFQEIPAFASTLNIMLLSLDRWLNIKFPQPAGKNYLRRRIVIMSAFACWIFSFLVNIPLVITHQVVPYNNHYKCVDIWKSTTYKIVYIVIQLTTGYIMPCTVTMICNLGIRSSLVKVSLSTRVAHGELPLPFPFMRDTDNLPILIVGLRTKVQSKENDENIPEENGKNVSTFIIPSIAKTLSTKNFIQKRLVFH